MKVLCSAICALTLTACGGGESGPARFVAQDCRAFQVQNDRSGSPVSGIEDIAYSARDQTLYLSSYDRLEKSEESGVYALDLSDFEPAQISGWLHVRMLMPALRPHGIAVGNGPGRSVWIVDHGSGGSMSAVLHLDLDGDASPSLQEERTQVAQLNVTNEDDLWCAANDLVVADAIYVTLDRLDCSESFRERIMGGATGRVAIARQGTIDLKDSFHLPNGIAIFGSDVWVAETRRSRMTRLSDGHAIDFPGAPDNLNASSEGIVAALQPSLWRFGLYRYGYTDRAPTRIVLVDPETEEIELLYDDPGGRLLSGATAAVLTDDGVMVASSVRGDRLLVCEAG